MHAYIHTLHRITLHYVTLHYIQSYSHTVIQSEHANSKYIALPRKTHKSQPLSQVQSKVMVNVTVLFIGGCYDGALFIYFVLNWTMSGIVRKWSGCPSPNPIAILWIPNSTDVWSVSQSFILRPPLIHSHYRCQIQTRTPLLRHCLRGFLTLSIFWMVFNVLRCSGIISYVNRWAATRPKPTIPAQFVRTWFDRNKNDWKAALCLTSGSLGIGKHVVCHDWKKRSMQCMIQG